MSINSFPIRTRNVTSLDSVSTAQGSGKLILVSGTGAYLISPQDFANSITISSSGVDTLNNRTGVVTLSGSGAIQITPTGQSIIIGYTGSSSSSNVLVTGTNVSNANFTGAGNVSVTTGITGLVLVSGNTGAYANFITPSQTGVLASSGDLQSTGFNLQSQINSFSGSTGQLTGQFINRSETGQFAASGNLTATGINLQGQINVISSWTGTTPNIFSSITHGHNYVTGIGVGSTSLTGLVNLTGLGNVIISTGISGIVQISGNTGAYANFITPSQTGLLTGDFVRRSETGGFGGGTSIGGVTSIGATGITNTGLFTGNVLLSGAGNIVTSTGNNNSKVIVISGDTGAYANFALNSATGQFVTTSQTGLLTGQFYPLNSNPSNYLTPSTVGGVRMIVPTGTIASGNISGNVIITGAGNVTTYTGSNGVVIISGNTGLFISYQELLNTSGTLVSLIEASNAGVSSLNGLSGVLQLIGSGNISIFTGGQGVTVSGNTGAYANFVTLSQTGGFLTLGNVGGVRTITATGTSQSGIISGNIIFTGAGNVSVSTGISGLLIASGNTGAYANFITPSQTGNFITNGQTGQFITTAQTGLFSSTQVTGSPALPVTNLTGVGNVTVTTGGGTLVIFSGNTGAYANFITPSQTGLLTGQFYPLYSNPSGYIIGNTGAGILNGQLLIGASGIDGFQQGYLTGTSGIIVLSGSGSLGLSLDLSRVITGLVAGTNVTVQNNGAGSWTVNSTASGSFSDIGFSSGVAFTTNITSGTNLEFISFPLTFSTLPTVAATPQITTGNNLYYANVSGITTSGFYALYSNVIAESGHKLNVYAFSGQGYAISLASTLSDANFSSGTSYTTTITSGINSEFIPFPILFSSIPAVAATPQITTGNNLYYCNISGVTTSGFYALYSNFIAESGHKLNVVAYTGNGFLSGLAGGISLDNVVTFLSTGSWKYKNVSGTQINPITVIDWRSGSYFYKNLTGNTTFIHTGNNDAQDIKVRTISTGGFAVTWPTGVKWPYSLTQTFSGTSGSIATGRSDIWHFTSMNGQIFGNVVPGYYE